VGVWLEAGVWLEEGVWLPLEAQGHGGDSSLGEGGLGGPLSPGPQHLRLLVERLHPIGCAVTTATGPHITTSILTTMSLYLCLLVCIFLLESVPFFTNLYLSL